MGYYYPTGQRPRPDSHWNSDRTKIVCCSYTTRPKVEATRVERASAGCRPDALPLCYAPMSDRGRTRTFDKHFVGVLHLPLCYATEAAGEGLEPSGTDPESVRLPLTNPANMETARVELATGKCHFPVIPLHHAPDNSGPPVGYAPTSSALRVRCLTIRPRWPISSPPKNRIPSCTFEACRASITLAGQQYPAQEARLILLFRKQPCYLSHSQGQTPVS